MRSTDTTKRPAIVILNTSVPKKVADALTKEARRVPQSRAALIRSILARHVQEKKYGANKTDRGE
jgi:hypothetical protein